MNKSMISGLVTLLILAALAAAAGCGGGDTAQAGKYMKQGDMLAAGVVAKSGEVTAALKVLQENTDPAARGAAWEQFQSLSVIERALLQRANAELGKMKGLKGVADYKRYAELKGLQLDAMEQSIEVTNGFFGKLFNNSFSSQQELDAALQRYQSESKDLQAEMDTAREDAEQFKKEKGL